MKPSSIHTDPIHQEINLMKTVLLATSVLVASALAAHALAQEPTRLQFVDHLEAGLNELDVFVDRPGEPHVAYRVRPQDAPQLMSRPLYAGAAPVPHNPFDDDAVGPHPKGRALGLTLADWVAAEGTAELQCEDGRATVRARFSKLVPNAVYTMWHAFVPSPPTQPFTGALDLPLGARDGSQTRLVSDRAGNASYEASFTPCLPPSSQQLMSLLALAWHSDGKTYGSSAGEFGKRSHVQLFAPIPAPGQGRAE
jgi:hypothetical protein